MDAVRSIVRFSYFNRIVDLTDKITGRVVEILEQQLKQRDDPDEVLSKLGLHEEWALATTNRIGLRM